MRLADFQRRMELQRAQTAAKLLQLWSVVWLQRLVRRRMAERSRLAAEVALVREPGKKKLTSPRSQDRTSRWAPHSGRDFNLFKRVRREFSCVCLARRGGGLALAEASSAG